MAEETARDKSPAEHIQEIQDETMAKAETKKLTAEEIKEKLRLERRKDFLQTFRIGGKKRIGGKGK